MVPVNAYMYELASPQATIRSARRAAGWPCNDIFRSIMPFFDAECRSSTQNEVLGVRPSVCDVFK